MPRYSTNPLLYDNVFRITIKNLKKWGYLKANQTTSANIYWYSNQEKIGSISIQVNTIENQIILSYNANSKPIEYTIKLIQKQSNLKKGNIWYFVCPQTNKLCRTLYKKDEMFLHRLAFTGMMYSTQIQSKKMRLLEASYGTYFNQESYYQTIYSKYFKTHYNKKPTKRYIKLMQLIKRSESIPYNEIEKLYYMK